MGIETVNPFSLPLLNTAILLSSGATITWAHHAIVASGTFRVGSLACFYPLYLKEQQEFRKESVISLFVTILLGVFFTCFQGYEYYYCPFTIADSVFGSCFFVATGFHGLHVLVGTVFLMVSCHRLVNYHFTYFHHFGFEASA
jgi:cytochrome c oxidase subunit 3